MSTQWRIEVSDGIRLGIGLVLGVAIAALAGAVVLLMIMMLTGIDVWALFL